MKVALVVPSTGLDFNDACAPLNLGYIASYLRKTVPGVEVKIIDGMAKQPVEKLLHEFQPDIVGVTAVTPQAPAAYKLLDMLRNQKSEIFTVIGGIHATQLPEEAQLHADCVVVGEGELAFSNIVKAKMKGEAIPAIVKGEPIQNLDDIPSPAYDLLDMEVYIKNGSKFPKIHYPNMAMVTSRGCPYRCRFCWNSARTHTVRYFSAQRIVDEILFFKREYNIKSVFFNDDEFLINTKRLKELAVLFEKHGINKWLTWGCQARARTINIPILELVKKMNCVLISIGLESGCNRILKYLKNNSASVEDNSKALALAKQVGITMGGSFIFGTPTETVQEMKETMNWCWKNHNLVFFGINVLTPYPGTEVWKYCAKNNLLPKGLSYEQLIPPQYPNSNMIIVSTLPKKAFLKMVIDFHRMAWLHTQVRLSPKLKTFFKLSIAPSWWYLWLTHPITVLKLMVYSLAPFVAYKNSQL